MTKRELHYFARGNTAAGLHSLVESAFQGLSAIYVLKGVPGAVAGLLEHLASTGEGRGWGLQLIHQPLDGDLLEGLIIEELSAGFVDGEAWPQDFEPAGTKLTFIDLRTAYREEKLASARQELQRLEEEIAALYEEAYAAFLRTLRIHDEWEKYYIDELDREKMNGLASELADKHLPVLENAGPARITHRFLGAATWRGAVDFVPNLTDRLRTRIYVKGRPGSGKSTLFRKLAVLAEERGIDTEVYHCGFDPNSLDMLVFPELSLAIFDSTAPHEHFPVREGDGILDVYELAITPGTDEKFAEPLRSIKERYSASMKRSISLLAEVKARRERLEQIYGEAADEKRVAGLREELNRVLNALAETVPNPAGK
ncbi:hypothetical protein LBW89_05165 [Paenibacillus sp. alder61]|uniref:hypothetical protein n=1 Tax=Paenibacillus sp. alder61 TaxID=2862948 RepID=UPI001CD788F5|nr:hypothetical protein [Paenibacillus sp. alder61]MCA1292401.1 hypothetical protein [Paenibacillus sp. alder61]